MAEVYPASLPQNFLREGFQYTPRSQSIESNMDVGPPKVRRTSTTSYIDVGGTMHMDRTQLATFKTFFNTTLSGGTKYFAFTDPLEQTSENFRFVADNPYSITPYGIDFRVTMRWLREP